MKTLLKMQKRNIVFSSDRSWICTGKEKMAAFNNIKITNQNSVRFVFRKCKQKKMRNHRDLLEFEFTDTDAQDITRSLHHVRTGGRVHLPRGMLQNQTQLLVSFTKPANICGFSPPRHPLRTCIVWFVILFCDFADEVAPLASFPISLGFFYVSRQEKFIGNIFSCTFCSSIHLFCPAIFASFFVNANEQIILAVACINYGPALHKCWNKIIDYSIFIQKQCGRHWIQILCTSHKRVPQNTPQKSMVYDATVKWGKNLQND